MPNSTVLEHVRRLETKISSLTTLVQKGFVGVDRRFDQVTDGIGRMVKEGFDQVDERFAEMDVRFDASDRRLASIERQLHHTAYQNELLALEYRVDVIERHTGISKR